MKRAHFYLALAVLSVNISSCNQDDDPGQLPTKKVVIEIQTPPNLYGDRDAFIIATGPDGTFLGFERIKDGKTLVMDTALESLPDKVNITVLTYSPPNPELATDNFRFYTETDVPTGSKWHYAAGGESFSGVGSATINVKNFPGNSFCSISGLGGYANVARVENPGSATVSAMLPKDQTDLFLSTVGTSNDPRYFKAESVSNGALLNLNYQDDFLPFDHVINVASDGLFWLVMSRGYNKPISQITSKEKNTHQFGFFYDNNSEGIRLGINDGYSSYWTFWYIQSPERTVTYEKWGAAPTHSNFEPIEGDFTMTNETLNGLHYTTTRTFHYLLSEFSNVSSARAVSWTTLRPIGSHNPIMNKLPEELLMRFPKLKDLDLNANLSYRASTFYRTTTEKATDLYIERRNSTGAVILTGETWSLRK
jgi:hypothetical protein